MGPLIDVAALDARVKAGQRTILLDVRWKLGDPHGREHYLGAHLPGAVFVDLATELAAPARPEHGRHPLPPLEQFQASARRWGINEGDVVVAYDDSGNMAAARLWWMLRDAGFPDVYLLDGGLAAWRAAGLPVHGGNVQAVPGSVTLRAGVMPAIDAAAAGSWARTGILLDARAGERYRGEFEPVGSARGPYPWCPQRPDH